MHVFDGLGRFLLVGVSNTAIGLAVIFVAWRLVGLPDLVANALGYGVGLLWSFALNRQWSFAFTGAVAPAFVRFIATCAVGYAANVVVLLVWRYWLGADSFWPHVAGVAVYTTLVFFGSRFFVFRPQ